MRHGQLDGGQRSETVHRANLSAILGGLHGNGPRLRSQLVSATGLTRSAIRSLVGELRDVGLVTEDPPVPHGTPGRPSPLVRLNAESATVLAFEVLVDSIAAAIVGLGGDTLDLVRVDLARGEHDMDDVAADLADLADELRPGAEGPLVGIGVAVAGIVRRRDGFVVMAPNLGWIDAPLATTLARRLRTNLPISVANDADLGALAEHRRGAAVGVEDILFVSGEVGVGGGLLVGGQALTGSDGFAGEIGHLPVNPAGSTCRCGAVGCWETEVGERVVLTRAGYAADAGRAGVEALLADAAAGSPRVLAALDELAHWLAVGLGGLVNVLNPRLIVLGGLHGRTWPFVQARLEEELGRHSLPASRLSVRIVPAALGANAPIAGAAELAFEPLLADPLRWFDRLAGPRRLASA